MFETSKYTYSPDGFKKRLGLTVILLNLLVYSLASVSLYNSRNNYEKRAAITTQNIASILEHDIDGTIVNINITLLAVKNEVEGQIAQGGINKESLNRYIIRQHSYLPSISALRMTDSKGDIVYGTGLTSGVVVNIADRDYFKFGQSNSKGEIFISKPILGRVTNKWVINIARRVNNPDGSFAGIVFGSLTFNHLTKLFSSIDIGKKGSITIRDEDLALIIRFPEVANSIGNKAVSKEFSDFYKAGSTNATFKGTAGIDKTVRLISYRKMAEYPMVIVVALAQDEYLADWQKEIFSQLCIVLFFSLFTLFSSRMLLARWMREKENEDELRKAKEELELRVAERTTELNNANEKLNIELNERKQAEEELRIFKESVDNSSDAIGMSTQKGKHFYQNKTFDMLFGDIGENPLEAFVDNNDGRNVFETIMGGGLWVGEIKMYGKGKEILDILLRAYANKDAKGNIIGLVGIHTDITESKQADRLLRENEEKYRNLFNNAEIAMFRTKLDGSEVLDVNQKFLEMLEKSREETIGKPSAILWADPAEREEMVRRLIADGRVSKYQYKMLDSKGGIKDCITSLVLYREQGILEGSILDITDFKKAEEDRLNMEKQLLHAQKLESLGVLAGGIAHDFNNILMAIIGNADLALMRINKESPVIDNLHKIEQAAARAADLAKQMLAYSGKGKFVVESIDLNILLEEMLHMLEVSISKKAVLRLNTTQYLPAVEADATQIRQIIMNLVINASEAIGDKSGVIAITTGCMDCDRNYLKDVWLDENLTDGLYVYLEIADSGCGMDKTTMAKLFDPFFTTKFTGRGLGMAAVLGIVRGHNGSIKVYSEPNKGTTFKILLPASNRPPEIFDGESRHDDWKGQGKVLLVDDEETVRGIGAEMLKELGFDVITAEDGRQAVEQFKSVPDIAFVILDLTMPHMDGEQCFRELRVIKSDVKVVMSSGFNEHEVTQKFAGKGLAGFIQKPYKLSVLKEAIRGI